MILGMMFCFTMNMVTEVWFYSMNVYNFSNTLSGDEGALECVKESSFTLAECLYLTFFAMAVVINIRNWIYYFIKIEEMATGVSNNKQV